MVVVWWWNMKFLVVTAALLAIVWTPSPQPGGAKHPAKAPQQVKQQANDSKGIGNPPAAEPVVPAAPSPTNPEGSGEASANNDQPVRITEPVAITTKPDYPTWVFSGLLVVVGFLQLWLLFGTLKATRDNAEAARLNADVLMEGSAAHLALAPRPVPVFQTGIEPQMFVGLFNRGVTPALNCLASTWIEVVPFPFVDFTDNATFFAFREPTTIDSNSENPTEFWIRLGRPVTEVEVQQLRTPDKGLVLAIRLYVEYGDAFGQQRYRNFGFFTGGEVVHFLPKYNDSGKVKKNATTSQ